MNHPTPETWVGFLYGELPPSDAQACETHLADCPDCRARVESWRTTQAFLDTDRATLTPRAEPHRQAIPSSPFQTIGPGWIWKAAIAAGIALFLGFLSGRSMGPSRAEWQRELAKAREDLRNEFQTQHRLELQSAAAAAGATSAETRRFLADFAERLQAERLGERRDLLQTLQALEDSHASDLATLRSDVGHLARTTGNGFRQAESQINFIASQLPAEPDDGASPSVSPIPTK